MVFIIFLGPFLILEYHEWRISRMCQSMAATMSIFRYLKGIRMFMAIVILTQENLLMAISILLQVGCISWCSRLQRIVALSITEAKYIAATNASKQEAIWLTLLCSDLGLLNLIPALHSYVWQITMFTTQKDQTLLIFAITSLER